MVRRNVRYRRPGIAPTSLSILAAALLLPVPAAAASFHVTTVTDTVDTAPGDGACADAGGACSLRAAVQEANALAGADRIDVPAGTYVLTRTGTGDDAAASGDLDVTDALTLVGASTAATTIDGHAADTVLDLHTSAASVALENLTVANGYYEPTCSTATCAGAGGVVVRTDVRLRLAHVDIRGNRAHRSNAMSAVLNHGCIDGNDVRVVDNRGTTPGDTAAAIGTIGLDGPPACITLDHADISDNAGTYGAFVLNNTRAVLRRSLVAGNRGVDTGALNVNFRNDVLLEDVTIAGNEAIGYGAMLVDGASVVRIRHATIAGNVGTLTGGIGNATAMPFGAVTIGNTILGGNRHTSPSTVGSPDCNGGIVSAGGLLVGSPVHTDPQSPPSTRCLVQPGPSDRYDVALAPGPLADYGGHTRSIMPPAPAIDAGVAAECTATDQRDQQRPAGIGCDIGAVEAGTGDTLFRDGFDGAR